MKPNDLISEKRNGETKVVVPTYSPFGASLKSESSLDTKYGEATNPSSEHRLTEQQRLYISEYYLVLR
ncbi:hypothetical protein EHQ12_07170 [Leptospira gomenensis]|uniref:Uncharacterized protein n=1 Tax=Leptospira gomenensis TaxID=2484974 RepID=A0A5F1YCY7_9LEPT|nr:hypothetical protein [Leptospira gomenensis]TGK35510.1 hypothetical protein EHQ17_06145 [Leptospira gomenensis]TGK40598.1 hypothetical protein EHQ12_07170 [Leptospira gomenensis]TGK46276.1 hypothetical protein EHQ07_06340 [Leptospira gomenensis]TGK65535.1 hypothetical protein EHQ13_04990 [Leptospira gomenensis]